MARGLMEVINISPGQPVYVEDYRMQDLGFEWNVQNEFDYRIEYLMTNRVVMTEISSKTLWGLSGWTPADSLEITQSAGVLQCAVGMADIGGRRYVRTGAGAITPTGVSTDDVDYWIRAKYDTSLDTHSFVAELASAAPQADTDTDKRVTLATAHWLSPNWTGTPVDKRTSNTQLTPPAVISGNAGSSPVLSLHQDGSGLGLLVTGGDVSVGDATYNQQLIVYGTSTYGITIYDDPNAYSVEMIAGAANTLKVQTIGGTAATINVATLDIVSGPDITSTGIDMNTGTITDCTSVTATTVTGTSLVAGASGITSSGAIGAPTAGDTINGIIINAGAISNATWSGTAVGATKGGTGQTVYTIGDILYANTTTTLTKLGIGASTAALMGGTTPSWDSTPTFTSVSAGTVTATGSGSSIASSASVGGVTLNSGAITAAGAISGLTTVSASGNITTSSGYVDCNYMRLDTVATATASKMVLGIGTTADYFRAINSAGQYFQTQLTAGNCYISTNSTKFSIGQEVYFAGHIQMASTRDITFTGTGSEIGTSSAYPANIYCNELNYVTLDPSPWDHVDDLAIIKSIGPYKTKKTKDGRPKANLSGLPKEIYDKKTKAIKGGEMTMLLVGAIKQLTNKVEELEAVIGAHIDAS